MKRKPIVGMSLKTYINKIDESLAIPTKMIEKFKNTKDIDLFLLPSIGTLYPVAKVLEKTNIGYGAQNIGPELKGPFTGELSLESVIDLGGKYVELGHAERKRIFKEDYDLINRKIILTLDHSLIPIICIGESDKSMDIRKELEKQITSLLKDVDLTKLENVIFAYEPEWAIGKEKSADAKYVHHAFKIIREILEKYYGKDVSEKIRIIYGGSVSKENAKDLARGKDVDGLFIGRFGHNIDDFNEIVLIVLEAKEMN